MNKLKDEKKLAVIAALVEGNSIRSIERMTGVNRNTIMGLLDLPPFFGPLVMLHIWRLYSTQYLTFC